MQNTPNTLKPDTLLQLLMVDKDHAKRLGLIEAITVNTSLDGWHLEFLDLTLDCVGIPEDEEGKFCRDFFIDRFHSAKGNETELKKFINMVTDEFKRYSKANPNEKIVTRKQEYALAEVLQRQYGWDQIVLACREAGVEIIWGIDLVPIVFEELGKDYRSTDETNFFTFVKTGDLDECLAFVEHIKGLF